MAPSWGPAGADLLGPVVSFSGPDTVYGTYGRLYLFVFLGILIGLVGLLRERNPAVGRLERWGFRVSAAGLVLAVLGNIPDYWVLGGTLLEDILFVAGTMLGLGCLIVGGVLLGVSWLRSPNSPRVGAWLLLLASPG